MSEGLQTTKKSALISSNVLFICISSLLVGLRLLARKLARAGLWYDDYCIIAALPLAWMPAIVNLVGEVVTAPSEILLL